MLTDAIRIKNIQEDLEYLIDEITALRHVIETIPVHERPGGEFSICEIFAIIDLAQTTHFKAYLMGDTHKPEVVPHPVDFTEAYRKLRWSQKEETETGIHSVLTSLLRNRTQIVQLFSQMAKTLEVNLCDTSNLMTYAESIVQHERSLLRQIAERVLSIKIDHQNV